jgi:hypothetical protein
MRRTQCIVAMLVEESQVLYNLVLLKIERPKLMNWQSARRLAQSGQSGLTDNM